MSKLQDDSSSLFLVWPGPEMFIEPYGTIPGSSKCVKIVQFFFYPQKPTPKTGENLHI